MRSYWIRSQGTGTVLEPREIPVPSPRPGEMLVRVHATSINRGDILAAIARHRADMARPAGVDGAGEVHALSEGVTQFTRGERVMFRAKGSFAEYVLVDPALATRVPAHLSWEQAAAVPISFITAWEALQQFGRLQRGEWLLVAGASSGVGVAAVQAAKYVGAKVIGVSGAAEKLDRLKALGVDFGICARGGDYSDEVLRATAGKGVDMAVNLVGGSAFAACLRSLADFGRLAVVGYVDAVMNAHLDLEAVHGKRLQIFGVSNSPLSPAMRAHASRGFERDYLPALVQGVIVPVVDRVFGFEEVMKAKAYVESGALIGKVVISLD